MYVPIYVTTGRTYVDFSAPLPFVLGSLSEIVYASLSAAPFLLPLPLLQSSSSFFWPFSKRRNSSDGFSISLYGDADAKSGTQTYYVANFFLKNCMKIKNKTFKQDAYRPLANRTCFSGHHQMSLKGGSSSEQV